MPYTVLGIFNDRTDAEGAIADLEEEGFRAKDLSIVMKDQRQAEEIGDTTGSNVAGGAVSGATTGAVVGGVAGLLAGTVLPGLAGFLIGGPIGAALGLTGAAATTVSGAATGAVAGGLLGALMGFGLPKEDAEQYETRINSGGILLAVPTTDRSVDIAKDILSENAASDIRAIEVPTDSRRAKRTADDYEEDDVRPERSGSYDRTSSTGAYAGAKGGESVKKDGPHFADDEETESEISRRRRTR